MSIFSDLFRRREEGLYDLMLKLAEVQIEQQKSYQKWIGLFEAQAAPRDPMRETEKEILQNLELAAAIGDPDALRILSSEEEKANFIRSLTIDA